VEEKKTVRMLDATNDDFDDDDNADDQEGVQHPPIQISAVERLRPKRVEVISCRVNRSKEDRMCKEDPATLAKRRAQYSVFMNNGQMFFKDQLRLAQCSRHGMSILMSAVRANEFPLAEFICQVTEGRDLDLECDAGDTALTFACRFGRMKFIELLVYNAAEINWETTAGRTALVEAIRSRRTEVIDQMVDFLISEGALVKQRSVKNGTNAMDWAKLLNLPKVVRMLDLGFTVQSQTDVLFNAIANGDMEKLRRLIGDGDFFEPNNDAKTYAKMEEQIELSRQANVEVKELKMKMSSYTDAVELAKKESKMANEELEDADAILNAVFDESNRFVAISVSRHTH